MSRILSTSRFITVFISLMMMTYNIVAQDDWANLEKYKDENSLLKSNPVTGDRIVFMGNSITEFWSVTDSAFFAGNPYINRGISGQTTPQMLIRFRPDVIDLHPSKVVILAGINDIAQNTGPATIEEIAGNIFSMVELAKGNNISPIICSVLPASDFYWRPGLEPAPKIVQLNNKLKRYCSENGIPYVDYYTGMVDNQGGLKRGFSEDGVHPNLSGYKKMESIIKPFISN